ncbi:MAG: SIS domain-containing protein [Aliarcobacter sp.]|nr:SIS domain-containing protein [Aliarcobacter sp.]
MQNFVEKYKSKLKFLVDEIDYKTIQEIVNTLDASNKQGGKIYIIGNGGSAATASHMVNDLGVGLKRRNIRNFNIESLADNVPVCTAIANDMGYENIFYEQVKEKIKKEDVLIAISCSGNSLNILKAVEYGKIKEAKIIGITGFDGGILKQKSDISFHVQTEKGQYGLVEDIHMILDHMLYTYFIEESNE